MILLVALGCIEYDPKAKVDSGALPGIVVDPAELDFGQIEAGATALGEFEIRSDGTVDLEVSAIRVGAGAFTLLSDPGAFALAPGESTTLDVAYTATGLTDTAWVSIFSNDPGTPEARVRLVGEAVVPAIALSPSALSFGAVSSGSTYADTVSVMNVGTAPLTVEDVTVVGDGFGGALSTRNLPFELLPGESEDVVVSFAPTRSGEWSGTLWVTSSATAGLVSAPLSGITGLPIAVCEATPDMVAANAETSTFDGSASYDVDGGEIVSYEWTLVTRPSGSGASLPSSRGATVPGFAADLAGLYEAALVVENQDGLRSEACIAQLEAVPAQDLWVELYWEYPNDDMDLHLVAPGGSLSSDTDCYFGNCVGGGLDWGVPRDADDDPRLDIDDIPGTGPENINISAPESGTFTVYVHDYPGSEYVWDNTVTVRVYLGGALAWEGSKVVDGEHDYTPFAEIEWPAAVVTPL